MNFFIVFKPLQKNIPLALRAWEKILGWTCGQVLTHACTAIVKEKCVLPTAKYGNLSLIMKMLFEEESH